MRVSLAGIVLSSVLIVLIQMMSDACATPSKKHNTATEFKILDNSSRDLTEPAVKNGVSTRVDAREIQVTPQTPAVKSYVLMAIEPKSGLYWWEYQSSNAQLPLFRHIPALGSARYHDLRGVSGGIAELILSNQFLYFTDAKAVAFSFSTPHLWIREVRGKAKNLSDVQEIVLAKLGRVTKPMSTWAVEQFIPIEAGRMLDHEFFYVKGNAYSPNPSIDSVSHEPGRWIVTLIGPNKDVAVLTLDESYKLLSAVRQRQPLPVHCSEPPGGLGNCN